jgi:ubiquinone/menaquinone biosynthesis C-methylase UbiE
MIDESDWHSTQNEDYLVLSKNRLNEAPLKWCNQFVDIINREFELHSKNGITSIKDIGCNVGHFARLLRDIKIPNLKYLGIDISETYLGIARVAFPELSFLNVDFSSKSLDLKELNSDITIISATFEHIYDYKIALSNMVESTRRLIVMRTFMGNEFKQEYCNKPGAVDSYLISQYKYQQIADVAASNGFRIEMEIDLATLGTPKIVCESPRVIRSQQVLVLTKVQP